MTANFFYSQAILILIYYTIAFLGGTAVQKLGVKVNYTRKINHFSLFFLPMLLVLYFPYTPGLLPTILAFCFGIISLLIYVKPIREHVPVVATAFSSMDRPEDRPHTLIWLITQMIATCLVMVPLIIYLYTINKMPLIYIPILINGIGDGLAEPIGIRFGKRAYQTRALFSKKRYIRTLEGSACVFITALLVIIALAAQFTQPQFIAALIIIPATMTFAEAVAPHTWDSPVLYTVAGLLLFLLMQI